MGSGKKRKLSEVETKEECNLDETSICEGKAVAYEEKLLFVSAIAKPMASRKLAKKLYKLIKKASKEKTFLRHGLKDVQSNIRKGEAGIVIIAGNVTPIDVVCHMPAVCEENSIPYVYTPSREDIGTAMGVKRSCLIVMVREHESYKDLYQELYSAVKELPIPF